jgi:hypothetical protein
VNVINGCPKASSKKVQALIIGRVSISNKVSILLDEFLESFSGSN